MYLTHGRQQVVIEPHFRGIAGLVKCNWGNPLDLVVRQVEDGHVLTKLEDMGPHLPQVIVADVNFGQVDALKSFFFHSGDQIFLQTLVYFSTAT